MGGNVSSPSPSHQDEGLATFSDTLEHPLLLPDLSCHIIGFCALPELLALHQVSSQLRDTLLAFTSNQPRPSNLESLRTALLSGLSVDEMLHHSSTLRGRYAYGNPDHMNPYSRSDHCKNCYVTQNASSPSLLGLRGSRSCTMRFTFQCGYSLANPPFNSTQTYECVSLGFAYPDNLLFHFSCQILPNMTASGRFRAHITFGTVSPGPRTESGLDEGGDEPDSAAAFLEFEPVGEFTLLEEEAANAAVLDENQRRTVLRGVRKEISGVSPALYEGEAEYPSRMVKILFQRSGLLLLL